MSENDDRKIPVVRPTIVQRGVRFPFRGFDPGPPLKLPVDAVALLVEEREYERSNKKYGLQDLMSRRDGRG
jgi:hypothetical protein